MRIPRIFVNQTLPIDAAPGLPISIVGQAANHIGKVLRMGVGRQLKLFNGQHSGHFLATIQSVDKKSVIANIDSYLPSQLESPLSIHLGQAISKGDRMDFTIQKSVELGVASITPLWVERCDVKLSGDRLEKKVNHWQQVAVSACEQCGRDIVPKIRTPQNLHQWLTDTISDINWVLDPRGHKQPDADKSSPKSASLLIGPEGGLSEGEIALAINAGFEGKLIGPRVLRTETAALTAVTMLQHQWGDF